MVESLPQFILLLIWKWRLVILLIAAGIGLRLLVATIETMLLFPAPSPSRASLELPEGARSQRLKTSVGSVDAVFLPPLVASEGQVPLLIYCHGNGNLIDFLLKRFDPFRQAGYAVLLPEYPGYGRSEGAPSEQSIRQAVLAAYEWAVQQPEVDPNRVIGWGRSLGGGAVCLLSKERKLASLILESTFTRVTDAAQARYGWAARLMRNRFDNLSAVCEFDGAVLILHGTHDRIVPVEQAIQLDRSCRASELVILPCGHNDCDSANQIALEFLQRQFPVNQFPVKLSPD